MMKLFHWLGVNSASWQTGAATYCDKPISRLLPWIGSKFRPSIHRQHLKTLLRKSDSLPPVPLEVLLNPKWLLNVLKRHTGGVAASIAGLQDTSRKPRPQQMEALIRRRCSVLASPQRQIMENSAASGKGGGLEQPAA